MQKILTFLKSLLIIFSSIWVCLFIWTHQPVHLIFTVFLMIVWIAFAAFCMRNKSTAKLNAVQLNILYGLASIAIIIVFFMLTPRNDREWDPEVARIASYQFQDGQVEIKNIRNFIWNDSKNYTTQWETRRYDLSQINEMDLVISHFMQGPVAHAFVTFGFEDGRHLAFSLEVRKEKEEGFSTIGGFFRQYELALVVGDENDLIYTRSNIRHEDVYIYPIPMQKHEMQKLFLVYLNKADELSQHAKWYNTLLSNCTTIIFDFVERVIGEGSIPRDYRVVLPGLLPDYLYDKGQLDQKYTLNEWKEMAHVNPRIASFRENPDLNEDDLSRMMRSGLPQSSGTDTSRSSEP